MNGLDERFGRRANGAEGGISEALTVKWKRPLGLGL